MTYEEALKIATEEEYYNDIDALSRCRLVLAGEYAFRSTELIEILREKPAIVDKLRELVKSDTAAERKWGKTEKGIREMEITRTLKLIDKVSSAVRSRIDILRGEAQNNY